MRWLKAWFGLDGVVGRKFYLGSGLFLMTLKYGVDQLFSTANGGGFIGPLTYLNPLLSVRLEALGLDDDSLAVLFMAAWALPFIWIGVSMSLRRARDAGWSPWVSILFLLPVVNLLLILALCVAPGGVAREVAGEEQSVAGSLFLASIQAVGLTASLGLLATVGMVFGLGDYSSVLFVATPFVMGVVSSWVLSRHVRVTMGRAIMVSILGLTFCGGALLLLALEGLLCLGMAAPLGYLLAIMGAMVGVGMSGGARSPDSSVTAMVVGLPLFGVVEGAAEVELPVRALTTDIVIEASAEEVWPNVIGFSELPAPEDWMMRTGVACPMRARIDGEGVGAVRYCEFTTGAFVEPITVWEPPHRLGFDVVDQPPSMEEWSPWNVVHAPHLVGTMQSRRGQFELIELSPNKTRLIGTTWYTLDLSPGLYWSVFSDLIVHRIHGRVLRHIKALSEG